MKLLVTGLCALAAVVPLAGVATAAPPAPDVPDGIAVGEGYKPYLIGHAVGVQIYDCNGVSWSLRAPRANLYGDNGQLIATHFGGPSWQAKDGSKVIARRAADPVIVDDKAIPWLLLEPTSATAGPDGDRLAGTKYIQRINTTGGLAPAASECNTETAGDQAEIPYTADYVFWKKEELT
ncbi:MAG TPA: DUF3455 domain-containing protein [Thermoleophilaceae bacterium]|nr:DUF3455 domain-containing protein [Thermoleophilaceae bacterium]